jgi:ABC-type Na+ transport system ATPase subunit NatA
VGLLGPNGSGKTTTLRMIAGFTTATSGRVTVAGYDMATQSEAAARLLGYLPEHPPLYDTLDVSAYLCFVAKVKGVRRADISTELERVTSACRLEAVFRREIYKLSKGYRQRLGLAQETDKEERPMQHENTGSHTLWGVISEATCGPQRCVSPVHLCSPVYNPPRSFLKPAVPRP